MTYAIVYVNCPTMCARDAQGNYHIYENKETAERICKELGEGYKVVPW